MFQTKAYVSKSKGEPFIESLIPRREIGINDVLIQVIFVGINSYDLKNYNNEKSLFPMTPGMEVTGIVQQVGANVKKFRIGSLVGVGKIIDSCRQCDMCYNDQEQYCKTSPTFIYNDRNKYNHSNEEGFPTFGGLSQLLVIDEKYVVGIYSNANLNLAKITPLFHSGLVAYSPMKKFKLKPGNKFGVIGISSIGHIAVKLGVALGAYVTVFSDDESKKSSCLYELKADSFILESDLDLFKEEFNTFDFILDTRMIPDEIEKYIDFLKIDGTFSVINIEQDKLNNLQKINLGNRVINKSATGSTKDIQELINLCSQFKIECNVELMYAHQINQAFDSLQIDEENYSIVIDVTSIESYGKKQEDIYDTIEKSLDKMSKELQEEEQSSKKVINLESYIDSDDSEVESDSD